MTTEMITLKLDGKFLDVIDSLVESEGYKSRTEFIRESVRMQVERLSRNQSIRLFLSMNGKSKKKISDADFEKGRELALKELIKEKGLDS